MDPGPPGDRYAPGTLEPRPRRTENGGKKLFDLLAFGSSDLLRRRAVGLPADGPRAYSTALLGTGKRVRVVTNLPVDEIERVYRFALRLTHDHYTAEEIAQETFLRAWRGRQGLRDAKIRRVWMFQIAANLWRDQLRRSKLPPAQTVALADTALADARSPERIVSEREQVGRVIRALDALPPRQRQVLYLFSMEDLSCRQIAEVLDISSPAVKASLSLARKTLRRRLEALETSR